MSASKLAEVVMKIWSDPAYKANFVADPKTLLESEGFTFPAGIRQVVVVQNTSSTAHFVIPEMPTAGASLSAKDLEDKLEEILSVQLVLPTILV